MVAGRRTGKTSFLRLLLDTSVVSPTATGEQLASVAKFVQGCGGHTTHIRSTSVNIELARPDRDESSPLFLTLIDTPALDFEDEIASSTIVSDILRHVDARFSESVEDERKANTGDHHVHLCIYFLDPDEIVPPSVSSPAVPLAVPRARTNSLSKPDVDSVILEPPVPTNPTICRPTLPLIDITTIRKLSARVNVLPVVARADTLTNDRLAIIKSVIKYDLAKAGIGFGIFDSPDAQLAPELPLDAAGSSLPLLPFALISPDIYSHSDGVTKPAQSRHDLYLQYTPSSNVTRSPPHPASKLVLRKYIRSYRWGCLDVMDKTHCDFVPLREAIFFHMETLQKYTREYLFERFRADYLVQNQPPPRGHLPSANGARLSALQHGSKPILAIDTNSSTHLVNTRHASLAVPHPVLNADSVSVSASISAQPVPELSPNTANSSRSGRQRTKKITVACNFCRSRKLKCDGGRPACGQCEKRSNNCDYTVNRKSRVTNRRRKSDDASESDREGEGDSGEPSVELEPSLSPEVSSKSSRRNSNVELGMMDIKLPPLANSIDRRDEPSLTLPPITTSAPPSSASIGAPRSLMTSAPQTGVTELKREYVKTELPPIATLSVPEDMQSNHTFPPLRAHAEPQTTGRRRTSSASTKSGRGMNGYGSKIVACNFCRDPKLHQDKDHPNLLLVVPRQPPLPCHRYPPFPTGIYLSRIMVGRTT
ncbi:unnamed protein product [Somion occarium]|uniref:Septin-type G domain-containing protein n=1 Tax=Somion occarium TaxID=3059160 RepID=A0ABP1DXS4_9APHY